MMTREDRATLRRLRREARARHRRRLRRDGVIMWSDLAYLIGPALIVIVALACAGCSADLDYGADCGNRSGCDLRLGWVVAL